MVCHYPYLFCEFRFQYIVCTGCNDLATLCPSLRDVAIMTVKGFDYFFAVHDISRSKAIHLLENSILEDRGCI